MAEHKNLADIMSGIWAADDPIQHILALTYEFDENQLANFVSGRDLLEEARISRKQLLEISRIRPVVAYDAAKTKENRSLPQLLELHPWKSRAFGCHHSKAYCIVTSARVHLVLGSFNLTQTGLCHNREVLDHFVWSIDDEQVGDSHVLRQWTAFLREQYLSRMHNSERSALRQLIDTLEARSDMLPAFSEGSSSLVFSGYGENGAKGLHTLSALWSQWFPDESPTGLFVVSPFFDQDPGKLCIAKDFLLAFPLLSEIHICTAEEAEPLLCKAHFGSSATNTDAKHALFRIPRATSEDERKVILAEAASQQISISNEQTLERKLHAKILLLFNGKHGISYAGSANFSRNAWLGRNQELGMARRENDIPALRKNILKGLYVESENRYADLPGSLPGHPAVVDDEEELTHELFPDFIEHITLERCPETNRARFVLHKGASEAGCRIGSTDDYRVTWGIVPLVIMFDAHLVSEWIENTQWQKRLLGGRNLAFYHHDEPDRVFWFPFQYSDSLINDKEYLLNITSSDWLLYYASNQILSEVTGQSYYINDVENDLEFQADYGVPDRESNTVIAMQRYLQQFGSVEDSFRQKIELILDAYGLEPDKQARCANHIKNTVLLPLNTLFTILRKEYAEKSGATDALPHHAFRLGELLLFVRELSSVSPLAKDILAPLYEDIESALHGLSGLEQGTDFILQSYLAFVLQGAMKAGTLWEKIQ